MRKVSDAVAAKLAAKTQRRKSKLLKALAESKGIVAYACEAAGVSRNTYYEWLKNDDDFKQKAEEITEATLDRVEAKLLEAINEDNLTAIIFYLKTKGRNRGYVERIENEHMGNAFEKLMKELPDEEE